MEDLRVTATVSSKDRYFTTLPLAVQAIALQTVRPDRFVLFDDGEHRDLRGVPPYAHLFRLLDAKGIKWNVVFGERKGQLRNHQLALDHAETELVWRLDDDNVPEPDCLGRLLEALKDPSVGAAGGLVLDPKCVGPRPGFITGKIEDILCPFNLQWYQWDGKPEEVDHLYSTFLYRVLAGRKAGGYCRDLSPVGHREETLFSHGIKRAGHRLLVTPEALTWHFRQDTGGIRSYKDPSLWARDDQVFAGKLREWGVTPREYAFAVLDNGLGDHIMFRSVLPEWKKKNSGRTIVLAVSWPEVFEATEGVVLASIADARAAFGDLDRWNVYKWAEERQWKGPMVEAFRQMYLP